LFVSDTKTQRDVSEKKTVVGSEARGINKYKNLKHKGFKMQWNHHDFTDAP
jgi:hypothetical protein